MDERAERVGKNEAVFRAVNERLSSLAEGFSLVAERADFVCECADVSCVQPIAMTLAEYEEIRKDGALFFIVPGHEVPDVESVVERREGYEIVRKHEPGPAGLARELDPRDD